MLLTFLSDNQHRVVEDLYQIICQNTATEARFAPQTLREQVRRGAEAFLVALRDDDATALGRFIVDLMAPRTIEDFPLAALHRAFSVFGTMLLPLLRECYGDDTDRILTDLQRLHVLIATILHTLVTEYETRAQAMVNQRHEQLQTDNRQLAVRLSHADAEVQTLHELRDSILQSMTSGLLVADKETHRILTVNRAMERMRGVCAAEMVGKTAEDVFADLQGLPLKEFAEEVERHGAITWRKHRLSKADGSELYRSIQGQILYNHRGENQGVIAIVDDISETEILREALSRYLSQQVVKQVLAHTELRSLQSIRREVTVLFADIRDFTAFAEQHSPEEVVDVLNQYFDLMVQILFEHQGTLDKFLGDGLMALFGAPLEQPDHPHRAVRAALDIQRALAAFNQMRRQQGQPVLQVGIGINSGEAIVGNIGSEKRMEYTAVGDMVNVAQRLQAFARGGEILVSECILPQVQQLVTVYDSLETLVKARQQPVRMHYIGPLESCQSPWP